MQNDRARDLVLPPLVKWGTTIYSSLIKWHKPGLYSLCTRGGEASGVVLHAHMAF